MQFEEDCTNRSGWLCAADMSANDGILSTTITICLAATTNTKNPILAALAGMVAAALSMAARIMLLPIHNQMSS